MDTMESAGSSGSRASRGSKRRISLDGNNSDGASPRSKRRMLEDDPRVSEDPSPWSGNGTGDYPAVGSGSRSSGVEQSSSSIFIEESAFSEPGDEEIIVTGRRSRFILPERRHPVLNQQDETSDDQEADEDFVSTQLVQSQVGTRLPGQASSLSHILNDDNVTANTAAAAAGPPSPLVISTLPSSSSSKGKGKQKAEETREPTAEPEATLADYTCPICFSPPANATLTPCGHICCGSCLFAAIKAALKRSQVAATGGDEDGARCPVCRAPIPGWDGKGGGVIGLKIRAKFSV